MQISQMAFSGRKKILECKSSVKLILEALCKTISYYRRKRDTLTTSQSGSIEQNVFTWSFFLFRYHSKRPQKVSILGVPQKSKKFFSPCWKTKTRSYKDKPLKLERVHPLKFTQKKFHDNRMSGTYSSRPLLPPPLKRLVKAVGLRLAKTES